MGKGTYAHKQGKRHKTKSKPLQKKRERWVLFKFSNYFL
jgi:hypothetical protein